MPSCDYSKMKRRRGGMGRRTMERKQRILGIGPKATRICQKCQSNEHWTYECLQAKPNYVYRSSRTKRLKETGVTVATSMVEIPEDERIAKLKAEIESRQRENRKRKRKLKKKSEKAQAQEAQPKL